MVLDFLAKSAEQAGLAVVCMALPTCDTWALMQYYSHGVLTLCALGLLVVGVSCGIDYLRRKKRPCA